MILRISFKALLISLKINNSTVLSTGISVMTSELKSKIGDCRNLDFYKTLCLYTFIYAFK